MIIVGLLLIVALFAYVAYRYIRVQRCLFEETACTLLDPCRNDPSTWRIPRVIYRTYMNVESAEKFKPVWNHTQANNPSFTQVLVTDDEVDQFMRTNFKGRVNDAFQRLNPNYGSARADLYRYCQLYATGGIYLDIKTSCGDLRKIIHPSDGMLLSTADEKKVLTWTTLPVWTGVGGHPEYRELQQFYIIAAPKHPLLRAAIEQVVENIETYDDAIYTSDTNPFSSFLRFLNPAFQKVLSVTGPFAYTTAILRAIREDGVRDFRVLCPHANGIIKYSVGSVNHTTVTNKKHYSKVRGPLVLPKNV